MGSMRLRTQAVIGALVVLVVAVLSFRFISPREKPGTEARLSGGSPDFLIPVRVAVARTGDLARHLPTSGTLRARREVEIQARVAGYLSDVSAFNGKAVRLGECLAAIDNREYRVAFERARAGFLNAQIDYRTLSATPFLSVTDSAETARHIAFESSSLDSLRALSRAGQIDEVTFERLSREREATLAYLTANRGDVVEGRSGLAQAREAFEIASMNLAWTSIAAPFDGVVADCRISPGMHVAPGQTVMKLLDLSILLVDVDVLDHEVRAIGVGLPARVFPVGLPGNEFSGKVLYVNPLVDPGTKTMKVTIALSNRDRNVVQSSGHLIPGMYASVFVQTHVLVQRLLVPRASLLVRDQRALVFTVERGLAKWRYVKTGESNDDVIEICSGLTTGDTVIVDGHYTLAHDAPVSITNTPP